MSSCLEGPRHTSSANGFWFVASYFVLAFGVVAEGEIALRQMLPMRFNWPLFGVALLLPAAPVFDVARQLVVSRKMMASAGSGA